MIRYGTIPAHPPPPSPVSYYCTASAVRAVAPAPVPVPAPTPTPAKKSSSSIATEEVAEGVALGALPWVVAPVVALAAARPLLSKVRLLVVRIGFWIWI